MSLCNHKIIYDIIGNFPCHFNTTCGHLPLSTLVVGMSLFQAKVQSSHVQPNPTTNKRS